LIHFKGQFLDQLLLRVLQLVIELKWGLDSIALFNILEHCVQISLKGLELRQISLQTRDGLAQHCLVLLVCKCLAARF
jgi:hypothetical protein